MGAARKAAVVAGSLVGTASASIVVMIVGARVADWLHDKFPAGAPGTNVGGGQLGSIVYLSIGAFAVALLASMIALLWKPMPRAWRPAAILGSTLVVVMTLSWVNFLNNDSLVPYAVQAGLNVVMAVAGTIALFGLLEIVPTNYVVRGARFCALAIVAGLAVALPLLFDVLWLVNRLGIHISINKDIVGLISASIGLISALVGLAKARVATRPTPVA